MSKPTADYATTVEAETGDVMRPTVGSLFTGIGGLDLGLERAGWEIVWQSEIKPTAVKVLGHHWPHVPNLGDITTIDWSTVERPTLIAGGFPCPDLSHAHTNSTNGARKGLDGPQSSLWRQFDRAVEALEPEWVIVENVDTWRSWVPTVRADLFRHGYASLPVELSAGSFGAPHRRPRHFVVAHAHGDGEPLLAINAEVVKLRPIPRSDSGHWRDTPSRTVLLDDGISERMGQNDLYGNAVVPQVAEWIGSRIMTEVRPMNIYSVSGPDGWRHLLRADTMLDMTTVCGQDTRRGAWVTHHARPSCPDCIGAHNVASPESDERARNDSFANNESTS